MCENSTPNPIYLPTGRKYLEKTDWEDAGAHPLTLRRLYFSRGFQQKSGWGHWTHNFEQSLKVFSQADGTLDYVQVTRGDFLQEYFSKTNGTWSSLNGRNLLAQTPSGWNYTDVAAEETTQFNAAGQAQKRIARNGWAYVYAYQTDGKLASVTNAFGRELDFDYNAQGVLASIRFNGATVATYGSAVPAGTAASYELSAVTYPDGSGERYDYADARNPYAVTAVRDAAGNVLDSYTYDDQGRATSSVKPQGAAQYLVSYNSDGTTSVQNPLGVLTTYQYASVLDQATLAALTGTLPGNGVSVAERTVNADGLTLTEKDFKGNQATMDWDTLRRLPVQTTRAASQPSQSQNVQIDWHPTFRLPARITETGAQGGQRVTEYTYDERGNVLSQTVSGSGLSARTRRWSYTAQNLPATATDETGAVTAYSYDQWGNLTSSTDALGRVTTYTHDAAGRLLTQTDPNGVLASYTYDTRARLLTQSIGGFTTTMTYQPTGELASVQQPSGYKVSYQYDAAQRLSGWSDNRGNSGQYTLDGMGNRTQEQTRDAAGNIAFQLSRAINNINRVASQTIGASQSSSYQYDANGDLIGSANGLGQSSAYGLDALRRQNAETNPMNATATLGYDSLNAIVQATDFKGVATSYVRDAQGNATQESSADIGSQQNSYDARGLPASSQDAAGRSQQVQRDALGRPTALDASAASQSLNSSFSYEPASGQLSQIQEANVNTGYQHDSLGRVTRKSQNIGGSQP